LPQALFVMLVLIAYFLAVYAAELFGFKQVFSIPAFAAVLGFVWFFFAGVEFDESKKEIQKKVYARFLTEPRRLWLACGITTIIVIALGYFVVQSETVVFIAAQEDEVAVYSESSGQPEQLEGYASKQSPFKKRYLSSRRTFIFKAPGYKDETRGIEIGKNWMIGEEKHHLIQLISTPKFAIEDVNISSGIGDAAELTSYPEELAEAPSRILRFTVKCLSPTPFEVTSIDIRVDQITPTADWSFPYFGEGRQFVANVVRGFTVLAAKPGVYEARATDAPTIGRKMGTATYDIRVFSEPSYRYQISILVNWIDVNNPEQSGQSILEGTWVLDYYRDWKSMMKGSTKPRVLFNCRVDKLLPALERIKGVDPIILIADQNAPDYLASYGIRLPPTAAVVPSNLQASLERLVPAFPTQPPRLCSLILYDEERLLIQRSDDPTKGVLVKDKAKVKAISKEFDAIADRLIRK
jgi:hypothetical protein